MSVNAVSYGNPANVQQICQEKKTGGAGKAWCSVFIPGLGQLCDGRTAAGLGYMGASAAAGIAGFALNNSIAKDVFKASSSAVIDDAVFDAGKYCRSLPKNKLYGAIALGLVSTGLWIANIVDAYKGNNK